MADIPHSMSFSARLRCRASSQRPLGVMTLAFAGTQIPAWNVKFERLEAWSICRTPACGAHVSFTRGGAGSRAHNGVLLHRSRASGERTSKLSAERELGNNHPLHDALE